MAGSPALTVRHLTKTYGPSPALADVSFDVAPGTCVALLGGNGAGKTTTLKCVLGIVSFAGEVAVHGLPVRSQGKAARRLIGYVPQQPAVADGDTCAAALSFLADLRGVGPARVGRVLADVGLADQAGRRVRELSGGMRQRLALAAALLSDPPLLLLDEPAASLDLQSRRDLHDLIARLRSEGRTVVLSTHLVDQLDRLADQVVILDRGRVAFAGPLAELARRVHGRRFVVNLNGSSPGTFIAALAAAGIGVERVTPAALPWEEVLGAAVPVPHRPEEGRP